MTSDTVLTALHRYTVLARNGYCSAANLEARSVADATQAYLQDLATAESGTSSNLDPELFARAIHTMLTEVLRTGSPRADSLPSAPAKIDDMSPATDPRD